MPAIISEELFIKAQKRFERDSKKYTNPNETQLLSNLVKCGECGCAFTAYRRYVRGYRYNTGKTGKEARTGKIYHKVSYVCSKRIRQTLHSKKTTMKRCANPQMMSHKLEKLVWDAITNILTDPNKLKDYVVGYTDNKQASKQKLEQGLSDISATLKILTDEKQSVLEEYANGEISKDDYSQQSFKLDDQIQQTKSVQDDTLNKLTELKGSDVLNTSLDQYCTTLRLRFDKANSFDTKRRLFLDYSLQFTKNKDSVVITGSIPNIDSESEIYFIVTSHFT